MANYSDKFFDDEIELTNAKSSGGYLRKYIAFIVVGILAGIVALWFILSGTKFDQSKTTTTNLEKETFFVDINDLATTMLPTNNKQNYIKISFSLELSSAEEVRAIEMKMPLIKDALQVFLRELRIADVSYSGGLIRLKEETLKRINKVVAPVILKEVLLKEVIVN